MTSSFRKMVLIPAEQVIQAGGNTPAHSREILAGTNSAAIEALLAAAQLKQAKKEVLEEPTLGTAAQLSIDMNNLMTDKTASKMTAAEKMRMLRIARNMYNRMLDATQAHRRRLLQADNEAEKSQAERPNTVDTAVVAPQPQSSAKPTADATDQSMQLQQASTSTTPKSSPILSKKKNKKKGQQTPMTPRKLLQNRPAVVSVPSTPQTGSGRKRNALKNTLNTAKKFKQYCIYKY